MKEWGSHNFKNNMLTEGAGSPLLPVPRGNDEVVGNYIGSGKQLSSDDLFEIAGESEKNFKSQFLQFTKQQKRDDWLTLKKYVNSEGKSEIAIVMYSKYK